MPRIRGTAGTRWNARCTIVPVSGFGFRGRCGTQPSDLNPQPLALSGRKREREKERERPSRETETYRSQRIRGTADTRWKSRCTSLENPKLSTMNHQTYQPSTLNPQQTTTNLINPQPSTLNPQPSTINHQAPLLSTINPQPSTLNPQPSTLNPQPSTLNPQPSTLNSQTLQGYLSQTLQGYLSQTLQGYLSHKITPTPLGSPLDLRNRPTVGSWGGGGVIQGRYPCIG